MNRLLVKVPDAMFLIPEKVTFGRHETFPLRYGWLTKGFQAYEKNPSIFDDEDSVVKLGVGRNMVSSIRYWLRACQVINSITKEPTQVGKLVFATEKGADPYLEDEGTLWLVHWLLASNAESATAWYWFFNKFHKAEFTGDELKRGLVLFEEESIRQKFSETTLKGDAGLITRMYVSSTGNTRMALEDALDSPLSMLGLITQSPGGRSFQSRPEPRPSLPTHIFAFAAVCLLKAQKTKNIAIENLMFSRNQWVAPGAIFRLTEQDLIAKVEELVRLYPKQFEVRETAGIYQLYQLVEEFDPMAFLKDYYKRQNKKSGLPA